MDSFFVYFCILRGMTRDIDYQYTFMTICLIEIIFDMFLFETTEQAWVQSIVPHLVVKDVRATILDLRKQVENSFTTQMNNSDLFDTSEFGYTSVRIAKEYSFLLKKLAS
jgi:hypothetical protein